MSQTPRNDAEEPIDAGRTSGGASLGHRQPADVSDAGPIRNNAEPAQPETDGPDDRDMAD